MKPLKIKISAFGPYKNCIDIDFGLSSDNSSADNWHTYQDVAEGMFILVDNKYGQGQK